jgi:hypothetical protein
VGQAGRAGRTEAVSRAYAFFEKLFTEILLIMEYRVRAPGPSEKAAFRGRDMAGLR